MRYLGAQIAARKTIKIKSAKFKLKEMEVLLGKIISSSLLTVQKIYTMGTFLLPSIDFLLLNGEVEKSQLRVIDKKIRGIIGKELKIKGLPIECHRASWRAGRLFYPSLRDRDDVLMIRSFAQMTLSHDKCIWAALRQFIEDEQKFTKIETGPTGQFLDCKEGKGASTGTSAIIEKTRRADKNQDVGLKLEDACIVIKANVSEKKTYFAIGIGRYLTQKVVRRRKIET
jgi:hypothetical protein